MKNKEIVVLSDFQHVLRRSTMYCGSVELSDEKVPIIRNGKICIESKSLSIGLLKLLDEVVSNSIDEAKRMKGSMKSIKIDINSVSNKVTVSDSGNGFYKGIEINEQTGVTNIESAVAHLRAGSNFDNDDISDSLIGTNGIGLSLVTMLSSYFFIETKNKDSYFSKEWDNFIPKPNNIKKSKQSSTGTTITFIPRSDIFKNAHWDKDIIHTSMIFKNYLVKNDDIIKNLKFEVIFDGEELDLNIKFFPENSFISKTDLGIMIIYENFDNSGSISFINSAMCSGIHQKVINDKINIELQDSLGHHFYETFLMFNLPPKMVRFGDQNKTKFVSTREDIEPIILDSFRNKLKQFYATELFENIRKKVEERKMDSEIKKLRNLKKKSSIKNSHKYFPPSGRIENLFIVEGECLHEDTKIQVIRDQLIIPVKIKDISINDQVFTHKNRFRSVTSVTKKIGKGLKIKTSVGDIICGKKHKWLVYDKSEDVFIFLNTENINPDKHKLVKNKLAFLSAFHEIEKIEKIESDKYHYRIYLGNDIIIDSTESKKFCIFSVKDDKFIMNECNTLKKGDLLGIFDK